MRCSEVRVLDAESLDELCGLGDRRGARGPRPVGPGEGLGRGLQQLGPRDAEYEDRARRAAAMYSSRSSIVGSAQWRSSKRRGAAGGPRSARAAGGPPRTTSVLGALGRSGRRRLRRSSTAVPSSVPVRAVAQLASPPRSVTSCGRGQNVMPLAVREAAPRGDVGDVLEPRGELPCDPGLPDSRGPRIVTMPQRRVATPVGPAVGAPRAPSARFTSGASSRRAYPAAVRVDLVEPEAGAAPRACPWRRSARGGRP